MQTETITRDELKAGLRTVQTIAEAIREVKRIPSGHLYAQVIGKLELSAYERILNILKNAGLIEIKSDEIIWKSEVK